MTRRPLTILLAAALALTAATATGGCRGAVPVPDRSCHPAGCPRASRRAPGRRSTSARSPAAASGGAMSARATGMCSCRPGVARRRASSTRRRRTACGSPAARPGPSASTTRRPASCSGAYTFAPAGFLNDLVVTDTAVYVTDSFNAWLDVIPLGPNGELPATDAVTTLPLSGITFEAGPVQRERHRGDARLAARRRFVHRRSLPGRSGDRDRDGGLDRRRERDQRRRPRAARHRRSTSCATPTSSWRCSGSARA